MKAALLALALIVGCAGSTHQRALAVTMATVTGMEVGFVAADAEHQSGIVNSATSKQEGTDALAAYRAHRKKFTDRIQAVVTAVTTAYKLDTDPSVANAVAAGIAAEQAFAELGIKP